METTAPNIFKMFGFPNFHSLVFSLVSIKNLKASIIVSCATGLFAYFTENYIGMAPLVYLAFVGLLMLEFWTGVQASIKRKEKVQSRKFARMILKIGIYTAILGMLHMFEISPRVEEGLFGIKINFYTIIYYMVFNMIVIQMIISVFENLDALGYRESSRVFRTIAQQFEKWFELGPKDRLDKPK